MSDKDFKVKNKLQVKGITSAGPVLSDASGNLDSTAYITTAYGGTGTTTSPASGQILYSTSGATYAPTDLSSLVIPTTFSNDAPSSPVTGQVWIEADSDATAFDTNIIRRQAFTATAGQTVFTTSVPFIDTYEQVFYNGVLILRTTDYTTSNSNTITLVSAAAVNDIIEVLTVTNLNSVNTYTQAEIESGYVSKSGGSTITASSASTKGLILKGAASQSANLLEFQNSGGTPLGYISYTGQLTTTAAAISTLYSGGQASGGTLGYFNATTFSASVIPVVVRGAASQTANLQEWQNSSGTVLSAITSTGGLAIGRSNTLGAASFTIQGITPISLYSVDNTTALHSRTVYLRGNSAGTAMSITSKGDTANGVAALVITNGGFTSELVGFGYNGNIYANLQSASTVGVTIKAAASQTANLQEWQNSSGTILSAVNASGGLELNGKDVEIMNIMGAF